MDKTGEWVVKRGETPFLTTPECTHTHTQWFVQVLFQDLAPLQRRDKGLQGEKKKKIEHEGMERIQNDGKLEKRCFRGERDHKRQLGENNILQVMTHTHTQRERHKDYTKKSHQYKLVPRAA